MTEATTGDLDTQDQRSLVRFDRTERAVHWSTALMVLLLLTSGAVLYAGPLVELVGRRRLVREIHVWTGLLLPLPILVGLATRARTMLRDDLRRIARWYDEDRRWWRRRTRRQARLGKFNPGQKLNAAFVGAALLVLLVSGTIMRWFEPFPDAWRTGATFVHDWFAVGLWASVVCHVLLALLDPAALTGMRSGRVPAAWARRKYPAWHDELTGAANEAGNDGVAH